jgi:hypothetical protein
VEGLSSNHGEVTDKDPDAFLVTATFGLGAAETGARNAAGRWFGFARDRVFVAKRFLAINLFSSYNSVFLSSDSSKLFRLPDLPPPLTQRDLARTATDQILVTAWTLSTTKCILPFSVWLLAHVSLNALPVPHRLQFVSSVGEEMRSREGCQSRSRDNKTSQHTARPQHIVLRLTSRIASHRD